MLEVRTGTEEPSSTRQSSLHVSFRISNAIKQELDREARRQNLSLNSLASRVFTRYLTFDLIAERIGVVSLNPRLFRRFIELVSDEELECIGRELGQIVVKQTFDFFNFSSSLDGVIQHYFMPVSLFAGWYEFNSVEEGSSKQLMFSHQYGVKWSKFLRAYIGGILTSLLKTEPKVSITEGLVTVRFVDY